MSGIFGMVRHPGTLVAEAELAPMAAALAHRGPDGIRCHARENAGFGHCMLHSTPQSLAETLPWRDASAGLTITADARLDNREALLAALEIPRGEWGTASDSMLILRAYGQWGENCVDHLLGDFAFAVWDERAQALFLARDPMGCKPLYYHCRGGLLVFASSALAVAGVPEVQASLDEGRVADYWAQELEGIDHTATFFRSVHRLPPAHCGHLGGERLQLRRYWELQPMPGLRLRSDGDYLEAFTGLYTEAVRTRLRCHTAPASMLSGGLDSSTIVALARDLLAAQGRGPLRTYSGLSPEGAGCPETRAVLAVIARGGLRATCLRPGNMDEHAQALLAALEAMEDPFDGGWALLSLMFLHTAGDGGRVLLSGVDGEHALGAPTGYIRYLLREGRLRAGWREAQGFSTHYYRGCYSPLRLYLQALRSALVPAPLRRVKQWLGAPWRYRALLARSPISPELARRADLAGRFARYQQYLANNSGEGLQAWHQHIMQVPYLIAGIERYERLASYFGVEVRHPLLDTRLLAFSAALPLAQKVRGGWSKFLLRRLAAGRLPAEVAWREGWEELGWQFEARLAQWLGRGQDFPMLGFYLDQWLRRCGCAGGEAGAKIAAAQNLAEKPVT